MSAPATPPDFAARLMALKRHPQLGSALEDVPRFDAKSTGALARVVFLGVWIAVCVVITIATAMFFPPAALVPLAMGMLGVYGVVRSARADALFDRTPIQPLPAVVVKERTKVVGGGEGSQADTHYYLALETEAGREERRVGEELFGQLVVGDAGVAYVKGERMMAFRTLRG